MNEKVLQAVIKLKDDITKPLKGVTNSLKGVKLITADVTDEMKTFKDAKNVASKATRQYEQAQKDAKEATKKHKEEVEEASGTLRKMGGTILASVGSGLAFASKKAIDFEYAMAQVGAISKASEEDLAKLTEEAKRLGATTKFTASEASEGMNKFAMAGYSVDKIMSATSSTLALATAGNTDLALTCDIVSDAMTGLKLSAEETGYFVDLMTATITSSNTDIAMMGETLKYVAPVAGSMGVKFEDLAIATGLMGNASVKASQAGTALRSGLTTLIRPVGESAKAMKKYGIEAKKTDKGQLDLMKTIESLRVKFKDFNDVQRSSALASIFGQEAMTGWTAIVTASDEDFNKLSESISNASGEAERISEIYGNTTKGALDSLGSAFEGVAINIGQAFVPMIKDASQALTDVATAFNNLDPALQENFAKSMLVLAGFGAVLLVLGLLTPVISGVIMVFKALAVVGGIVAGVIAFICTPVGAVIAIMMVLTATVLWFRDNAIKNFEDFKNAVKETVDKVTGWWQGLIDLLSAPIKAVVSVTQTVKETFSGGSKKKDSSNAFGLARVPRNDYIANLHQGERVLTRQEADRYDKGSSSSSVIVNVSGMTIREEADIDRVASALVRKINQNKIVLG